MTYEKITIETWDKEIGIPECPDKGAFEVIYKDSLYFIIDGKLHKEDGPALLYPGGTEYYYQNDQLHRTDGPAIIHYDKTLEYYQYGELHRTDGPAVIYPNGAQFYYKNDKLHRTDGPAVIRPNGDEEYFLFDQNYSKKQWEPLALQLRLKEQIL